MLIFSKLIFISKLWRNWISIKRAIIINFCNLDLRWLVGNSFLESRWVHHLYLLNKKVWLSVGVVHRHQIFFQRCPFIKWAQSSIIIILPSLYLRPWLRTISRINKDFSIWHCSPWRWMMKLNWCNLRINLMVSTLIPLARLRSFNIWIILNILGRLVIIIQHI